MRVLVTGSEGFIGSVLVARGKEQGHQMMGVDDYSRGLNKAGSIKFDCREGISQILDEFVFSDSKPPFDAVVHLAAGTGSLSRPYEELVDLNVEMTKKIYEDAVKYGVKVFAFPTTSLIEGVPDSPYVRSKQTAMDWILTREEMNILPFQFYNVTGGYKNFSEIRKLEVHIVPIMLECFMQDKPFVINGNNYDTLDGSPGRDFSNVVDVTDFMLHLIKRQLEAPFKSDGVIRTGTGQITTALQMVSLFNKIMKETPFQKTLKYEFGPIRPYDCGWLRCSQPYLHVFKKPTLIEESLRQELDILLRVVYDYEGLGAS